MIPSRSCIFIGLNIVRILSIVSLILVFSSSIFVMVNDVKAFNDFQSARQSSDNAENVMANCDYIENSTVPNQAAGIFWAVVSRLLLIFEVIILFMSEIGWPAVFFDNFFPVLGKDFGLGALGIFECLIGAQILSHHVDDFTLVAAFFLFSLGCLNILLGLIFRESAKSRRSVTSWRAEAKGILPTSQDTRPVFVNASPQFVSHMFTGESEKTAPKNDYGYLDSRAGYGFGRQGEKAAGLRGFLIRRPSESLPRYATRPSSGAHSVHTSSERSSFASPNSPPGIPLPEARATTSTPPLFKSSKTAL